MQKAYKIACNLFSPPEHINRTDVVYQQGDNDVYPLTIHLLTQKGAITKPVPFVIPEGSEVWLAFKCLNGADKIRAVVDDAEKGIISCNMSGSPVAVAGEYTAKVELYFGGQKLSWPAFRYRVAAALGDANPPTPYKEWTEEINASIAEIKEQLITGGGTNPGWFPDPEYAATDEEVEEMLDEIFGKNSGWFPSQDYAATSEEIEEMLNEIFGTSLGWYPIPDYAATDEEISEMLERVLRC